MATCDLIDTTRWDLFDTMELSGFCDADGWDIEVRRADGHDEYRWGAHRADFEAQYAGLEKEARNAHV